MANTNADRISGGSVAGGILNLSDADLIALVLQVARPVTDVSNILISGGTVPSQADETWGVLVT